MAYLGGQRFARRGQVDSFHEDKGIWDKSNDRSWLLATDDSAHSRHERM